MDPLLTIITVTRNDADRLSKTIRSLKAYYDETKFEHVVMDGGSTDSTNQLIQPLENVINFKFYSEVDGGIYDAMNKGVQRSAGKYIIFLNSGDCMLIRPEQLSSWLEDVGDASNADIMCFPFTQVDNDNSKLVQPQNAGPYRMPTSHQAMIFLADFVRACPYDMRYKIAADYDLYMRADKSRIFIAPMVLSLTAVEIDGVASSSPVESYKEYLSIAFRNCHGLERLACLIRIGSKALFVILLKSILTKPLVQWLRRVA